MTIKWIFRTLKNQIMFKWITRNILPPSREEKRKSRLATIQEKKKSIMEDIYKRWRLNEIQIDEKDLQELRKMETGPCVMCKLETIYKRYL